MRKIALTDFDGNVLTRVDVDPTAPIADLSDLILSALYGVDGLDESDALELAELHTFRVVR